LAKREKTALKGLIFQRRFDLNNRRGQPGLLGKFIDKSAFWIQLEKNVAPLW
jgi:hypothetical protein